MTTKQDLQAHASVLETVVDLVRFGASRFNEGGLVFGHGADNALDEALTLVLHALHLGDLVGPDRLVPGELFGARVTPVERDAVLELFRRRIEDRVPVAYLVEEAWFAGLSFFVDRRVLIPRSPFAELVAARFEPWLAPGPLARIVDVGTGSGCIAIACAHAFPEARVDAVDLDPGARAVAAENVARHGLEDRVRVIEADVLEGLDGSYDLMVSNPPYVSQATLDTLPPEYRHEPMVGLAGGVDGLEVVRRLLTQAPARLAAAGALFLEVGESRAALEAAYPDLPFVWLDDALEHGGEGLCYLEAPALR